jgi:hypothetical protein
MAALEKQRVPTGCRDFSIYFYSTRWSETHGTRECWRLARVCDASGHDRNITGGKRHRAHHSKGAVPFCLLLLATLPRYNQSSFTQGE